MSLTHWLGVLAVVQQDRQRLCSTRTQVQFQARHSTLKDPALLQLWHRSKLRLRSDPWLGNSICQGQPKNKTKHIGWASMVPAGWERQAELSLINHHLKPVRCLKRPNTAPSSLIREMKPPSGNTLPKGKWSIISRLQKLNVILRRTGQK